MTVAGIRVWQPNSEKANETVARMTAQTSALLEAGVEHVFYSIRTELDRADLVNKTIAGATIFGQSPWGKFTPSLNGLLTAARPYLAEGHNMLFLSGEVLVTPEGLAKLESLMGPETLCVGAALEGHKYELGEHPNASGRQMPWNTLAEWNGGVLSILGFPMIGDGPLAEPDNAGVEELTTGAILQALYPTLKIYLTEIPGQASWDTSGFDAERQAAHEKKMSSKDSRPARQLEVAHIDAPTVWHV